VIAKAGTVSTVVSSKISSNIMGILIERFVVIPPKVKAGWR
jgi:hypothetical protein